MKRAILWAALAAMLLALPVLAQSPSPLASTEATLAPMRSCAIPATPPSDESAAPSALAAPTASASPAPGATGGTHSPPPCVPLGSFLPLPSGPPDPSPPIPSPPVPSPPLPTGPPEPSIVPGPSILPLPSVDPMPSILPFPSIIIPVG